MSVRPLLAVALTLALAVAPACGDDDGDDGDPQPAGPRPTAAASPGGAPPGTPAADATPATGDAEVIGIVGAVSAATNTIEINRVSGADIRRIEVTPATSIRDARAGERLRLDDLRPSDRLVARGAIQGDTLVATEIAVQSVVPGADPGG